MSFDDDLAVTEAVLLSAGFSPAEARRLTRASALTHRALYDGVPLNQIRAEAWRYAGLEPPRAPAPPPAKASPLPPTLPTGRPK